MQSVTICVCYKAARTFATKATAGGSAMPQGQVPVRTAQPRMRGLGAFMILIKHSYHSHDKQCALHLTYIWHPLFALTTHLNFCLKISCSTIGREIFYEMQR